MTQITTTSWLIWTLAGIQSKKLNYNTLIAKLELELQESELVQRINKGKQMLLELNIEEEKVRQNWIEILQNSNIDKFEANGVKVRLKTSAWRLKIENEEEIPDEYKKEKTTVAIDKKAIKDDMKEWVIIDWVSIEQTVSLEIKYS